MKSSAETVAYDTATGIGKLFDPPLTAQEVNARLEAAGLHVKDEAGVWRATKLGSQFCVFISIGPGGMNKWKGSAVVELLKAKPAAAKPKTKLGAFAKKAKVP
ncbi:hypothetical protein WKW77_30630 [Variovorax ureilyticus]|uniref:Uncharacterized protein n=1 Tax=Variovorax ureilyticus TaxID=1836198 RepID=A0ABU8VPF6_9BURK